MKTNQYIEERVILKWEENQVLNQEDVLIVILYPNKVVSKQINRVQETTEKRVSTGRVRALNSHRISKTQPKRGRDFRSQLKIRTFIVKLKLGFSVIIQSLWYVREVKCIAIPQVKYTGIWRLNNNGSVLYSCRVKLFRGRYVALQVFATKREPRISIHSCQEVGKTM